MDLNSHDNSRQESQPVSPVSFVLENKYNLAVPDIVRTRLASILDKNPNLVGRLANIMKQADSPNLENQRLAAIALENFINDIQAILEG